MQAADWSGQSSFTNFYSRAMAAHAEGLYDLGPIVAAQMVVARPAPPDWFPWRGSFSGWSSVSLRVQYFGRLLFCVVLGSDPLCSHLFIQVIGRIYSGLFLI